VGCASATDTSAAISMHTIANRTPIVIRSLLGGVIICTCNRSATARARRRTDPRAADGELAVEVREILVAVRLPSE
jgi:hypothetical protein